MHPYFSIRHIVLMLSLLILPLRAAETDLETQFQSPPDSARPRTWWHWVSGNVSSNGITADLRAMKEIGLGGCQLFTVDQSDVHGPVKFMSPEWRGFVQQALGEADKLGLQISVEGCDGWSESGGPWITPEQGMQHVVWTEKNVVGGRTIALDLPTPPATRGFYRDIALLAFPALAGDDLSAATGWQCSDTNVDIGKLFDGHSDAGVDFKNKKGSSLEIVWHYATPVTCASLAVAGGGNISGNLQASIDGVTFSNVAPVKLGDIAIFSAVTATHFRLKFSNISVAQFHLSKISLAGARLPLFAAQAGMQPKRDIPFIQQTLAAEQVIDPAKIIDLTGRKNWNAPLGRWTLIRVGHTGTGATTHPSTTPGLECDKLSRAAVRYQFEQMFGPILADSPQEAGRALHSILLDSWECGCGNWTPLMPQEFAKRRGYDLARWLPVFTGRVVQDSESTQKFLWDLRRTVADLLTENHYGVVQEFAHEHHLKFYAEAPGIGLPTVADNLACKGRTDFPMGEFWLGRAYEDNVDDAKEAASAAHIYGKPIAATESFTAFPSAASWANDPYSLKQLGDFEFCNGVNRFIFHRYAHQPWDDRLPGMSMGPWGINFERSNTWWKQGTAWIDYLTRCEYLLQQGRFVADALYFYGEGAAAAVAHRSLKPVLPEGFDYDVCNAEILLNQMSVEYGEIVLQSGMRYRVLILPDTNRMTVPVLKKIGELVRAGATVYGPRPTKSPSLAYKDSAVAKLAGKIWGDCDGTKITAHNYGQGRVLWGASLADALPNAPDFAASQPAMKFIHRTTGDTEIYFISNQQKSERTVDCAFRVSGKVPELWHPDSGRMETAALYRETNGVTTLPIAFDPVGSVFVIFRHANTGANPVVSVTHDDKAIFADGNEVANLPTRASDEIYLTAWSAGGYQVQLASGKTLSAATGPLPMPLAIEGAWQVSFPPNLGAPATTNFDRLMSWTESADDGIKYFSGTATYEKELEIPADFFSASRKLLLDLGAVKNLAEVDLNGKNLGILWKEPFRVDMTDAAVAGTNRLKIRVTNLWPNRLIGDEKLPAAQRITWASVHPYKANSPLLPSGLLGPMRILTAQTLTLKP
jgi:alpha-L-rhamnosidase